MIMAMVYFGGSQTWLKKYRCQYRWIWERWDRESMVTCDRGEDHGLELGIRTPKPGCPRSLWTQPLARFESSHIVYSSWGAFSLHLENSAHYSRPSSDVASFEKPYLVHVSLSQLLWSLLWLLWERIQETKGLEFRGELEELSQLQITNNKGSFWRAGWKLQDKRRFMMSSSLFHLLSTLL